jgi:hypothetical protein
MLDHPSVIRHAVLLEKGTRMGFSPSYHSITGPCVLLLVIELRIECHAARRTEADISGDGSYIARGAHVVPNRLLTDRATNATEMIEHTHPDQNKTWHRDQKPYRISAIAAIPAQTKKWSA